MTVRPMREDDREQVLALLQHAFNQPAWMVERARTWPIDDFRVRVQDGQILATTAIRRFAHFFGGRSIPCAGISGVTVAAHARGGRMAEAHVAECMREARETMPISALWPATVPLYRRLGYEYGLQRFQYKSPIRSLPRREGTVEPWDDKDLHDVALAYRDYARRFNGMMDRPDTWWQMRILPTFGDSAVHRYLVREAGQVTGSIVYTQEEPFHFDIEARDLFATTPVALRSLLAFVSRFGSMGRNFLWYGPPSEPIGLLLGEEHFEVAERGHMMFRLLDLPKAIEARGYPAHVRSSVTILAEDALFPENSGPWRIAVSAGEGAAEGAGSAEIRTDSRTLAAIYTGFLAPSEARRIGLLDGPDAAVDALAAIFAGPDPWTADFF
ncbi:MAG: GNAT family N-acetyltransferase [Actinomycetota bacterium]